MSAGWDFSDQIAFASLIVAVVGVGVPVALHYSRSTDYHEKHLREDPTYRTETAAKLRSAKPGTLYRNALSTALDWLDRRWDAPDSPQALGVCTVISLCYAWAAFYLAYALGAPGRLGEIAFVDDIDQPGRAIAGLLGVVAPAIAFFISRWLGRIERRCKSRLLRRGRRQHPSWTSQVLQRRYQLASAIVAAPVVGCFAWVYVGFVRQIGGAGPVLCVLPAVGAVVGLAVARRLGHRWLRGLGAALAGGAASYSLFVLVVVLAEIDSVGAVAIAGAVTGAGAGAGAVAGAVARFERRRTPDSTKPDTLQGKSERP